jgi:nucleotide-binding universal stress UspA family protein
MKEETAMYQHILIALESKPTDEAAIAHATALARQVAAKVTLLRVVTVAADGAGGLGKQFQTEPGSNGWRRINEAEETLTILQKRLQLSGLAVETALIVGDRTDADEVVAFADEGEFDLIVMAADGRSWWQRALFGCPADGVQRKATLPTRFVSDGTRCARVPTRQEAPVSSTMALLGAPGM